MGSETCLRVARVRTLPGRMVFVLLLVCSSLAAAAPKIQSWHTDNGAKVVYVAAPELPMVDVRVIFDAGSARDGTRAGLAGFVNAVLDQGAGDWNADQIAVRLEDKGVEMSNSSLRDMAWYSMRSLTRDDALETGLDTLATVLAKPRFATDDVERLRQQLQVALRQQMQSADSIAQRRFMRELYGDHPYAGDPIGEETSLAELTVDELKAFHRQYYVASNAVVAIVGAVDRAQAERIADRLTRDLPTGDKAPALPELPVIGARDVIESFPSTQTHIFLGMHGISRHDPDYFPLYVGNHVLGGSGLVSQLAEEVRNKRGLSYSVYSYFNPMRAAGPFIIGAQTKSSQADEAKRVMRETLVRFIEQGPTEAELEAAQQNLSGGFPRRISSNKKIVEYIAMIGFYDYPLDWLETLVYKINAVTVTEVRDAFRRRIDPDRLVSVVVGQ